jgi:predicted homoserine dehydrogenase-like protein
MILIDTALQNRERLGNPIKVGMIGSGEMGKGMINQIENFTPGMKVSATYGRETLKVEKVYHELGINDYLVTNDLNTANEAVAQGKSVITSEIDVFVQIDDLDVLVEATGAIDFAVEAILKAYTHKKNVLSFNAELDSTLGPILLQKAKDHGVRYALGDGDQPGVTMNLYRYVKMMGFEPLVCGNIKGMQDRYRTPETQKAFAASWGMNPYMATNFADGTKISFEQSCIANATGMKVAHRGMIGHQSTEHVDKLTHLFDVDKLREMGGIVDYIVGAQPAPGVFVYAASDNPISVKYLKYGKLGEGPLYCFYVPFHLLFFDIASSISRLIDFNDPVIVPKAGSVVDVVTTAKTDLKPGDILDGIGGFKSYGLCDNHSVVVSEKLLPMGLSHNCIMTRPVKKDQVITYDDVQIPEGRLIDQLMEEQNTLFQPVEL